MTIGLRLRKGVRLLDLNSGRYQAGPDVVPPATNYAVQTASGTSLNRSGASLVDKRAQNRTWAFSVIVTATEVGRIRQAVVDVQAMLDLAGDEAEPLLIEYRASNDVPEPHWGQFGAWLRYEVVYGSVVMVQTGNLGWEQLPQMTLTFEIRPFARGPHQRLCSAKGGLIEDKIGSAHGQTKGLIVSGATTNLCTNPVFGHSTWDNGWTAGANIMAVRNTNMDYALPDASSSARLTAKAAAANTFTQSLTLAAATHVLSAIIKLHDGSTPSATQMQIYYNGAAQATTFTEMGNGVWVAEATVTGTGGATTCGVQVRNGYTVYVLFFQAEQKAYRTAPCWGDRLGCAWSGTAHASSSTRTAGVLKISTASDTALNVPLTVRVAFKTGAIATVHDTYLIDWRDGGNLGAPYLYIATGGTRLTAVYNAYSVQSQVLAANTWYMAQLVIGSAGELALYVNAVASSTATAGFATLGSALYVGCDYSSGNQCDLTLGGLAVFETALTAAEIAADYAAGSAVLADERRLETIPWLWTKDGDGQVDNCNDATRNNWCVAAGVPGTADARTLLDVTASGFDSGVMIGRNVVEVWVDPGSYLYADYSGTADGNSSGGAYHAYTIDTSGLTPIVVLTIQDSKQRFAAFNGREFVPLMRIYDVGASQVNYRWRPYSASGYTFDNQQIIGAAWQMARLRPFRMPDAAAVRSDLTNENINVALYPKRAASSADIRLDYILLMPTPTIIISAPFLAAAPSLLIDGLTAVEYAPAANNRFVLPTPAIMGDELTLTPDDLNTLVVNLGETITRTLTFNRVVVEPRWELL